MAPRHWAASSIRLVHVDVYRLLDHAGADLLAELDSLDLDTDLDDAVVVVEWGEGLAERKVPEGVVIEIKREGVDVAEPDREPGPRDGRRDGEAGVGRDHDLAPFRASP